ncbi:hypothetical protein CWI75_06040 [Kineobactrum sediminis]|uniref:ABC-type transport auxiliary lipoprotein component domain-containing protein n=1 Tax=Kineobactrum sediminis TaxID=1905677 RepID=A0A2N5Y3L7_9GAMM|nr:PqiC family protein [Kineobactrum sediminis]PLW82991.1 hypothetical protein CWI75_06040 [Kineobactrum sediminis]
MTIRLTSLGVLLGALLLAGCASSPSYNYYLLNARVADGVAGDGPALGIGPITIPEYLNRTSMVFTRGSNQLRLADYDRWAEPLAEGIQRVLSLNLSAELGSHNIRPHPWARSDVPDYAVQVWLLSLDIHNQRAELVAEWRVSRPAANRDIERRISRLSRALPDANWQPADAAAAYSDLLQSLGSELAAVINNAETKREAQPGS